MAGGVFSSAKLNGMTIRESATDGSDFTNPDVDYRRLFLGEDGQLHVKDSAGAVTDIGVAGGSVATDAIWDAAGDLAVGSGSNTAARLAIGNAGGLLARINGAVAWNAGTSFPTAATGDRYFRTDRGIEYYYDGTRWVTVQLFTANSNFLTGLSANTEIAHFGLFDPTYTVWLVELRGMTYVGTTNDGTKYWTVALKNASDASTVASFATNADSVNTINSHLSAIGAVSTEKGLYIDVTKTSTPGNITPYITLVYRLVG